jgi:hypothetical protein
MNKRAAISAREQALVRAAAEFCARFEEGVTDDEYTYCRLKNALGTQREEFNELTHEALQARGKGAISQCSVCGASLVMVRTAPGREMACEPDGRPHGLYCPAGRPDNG